MPAYLYRAAGRSSRRLRGRAHATDLPALSCQLAEQGLVLIEASVERTATPDGSALFSRHSRRTLLDITRGLASLLAAGVPLARALATVSELLPARPADVLRNLRVEVEKGQPLADALARHPELFPPAFIGVVRAGERAGDLAGAFTRLTDHLERESAFRARIASAVMYPLVLGSAGAVALLVLLFFVLPRFVELLGDARATLPATTALLLGITNLARTNWGALICIAIAVASAFIWLAASRRGKHMWARLLLTTPVIGGIRRKIVAARFARLLSVLLRGGATVFGALHNAAESVADPVAKTTISQIRASVREGASLSAALARSDLFPPVLAQLTTIGEESGQLPEFLQKAAEIFERETQHALERAVTLLEPAMIIAFGGAVAVVALSLLQAVYSVNRSAF